MILKTKINNEELEIMANEITAQIAPEVIMPEDLIYDSR